MMCAGAGAIRRLPPKPTPNSITRGIRLNIRFARPQGQVTEASLAIAIAQQGGIG